MFEDAMNQSNPVFGEIAYVSNNKDMAEHGYITPMNLVYTRTKDSNGWESYKKDIGERLNAFIDSLIHIAEIHDINIVNDSKERRRGFLLVTVSGNQYLEAVRNSSKFLTWANNHEVGVYMTSAGTDKYTWCGKGRIKKAKAKDWEKNSTGSDKLFEIEDFVKIINGTCDVNDDYKDLELTREEINNHMNIILNINQCNTGIDLPSLNGVYISKLLNKDNPDAIQIPGRTCRPDSDDQLKIGKKENCPVRNPNNDYVKPYAYIYMCLDEFTFEERADIQETFDLYYKEYFMAKITLETRYAGVGDEDEKKPKNPPERKAKDVKETKSQSFNVREFENLQIDLLKEALSTKTHEEELAWWTDTIAPNMLMQIEKYPNFIDDNLTEDEKEFCLAVWFDDDMKTEFNILKFVNIINEHLKKYN